MGYWLLGPASLGLCFLTGWLLRQLLYRREPDLEALLPAQEPLQLPEEAQPEREKNLVPLGEALAFQGSTALGTLMEDLEPGQLRGLLGPLSQALDSPDRETAHWAAAVLSKELGAFRLRVASDMEQLELETDPIRRREQGQALLEVLLSVLEQKVFSTLEQRYYVGLLGDLGEMVCRDAQDFDTPALTAAQCGAISRLSLNLGDTDQAARWCQAAQVADPRAPETYDCHLGLLLAEGDREGFFNQVRRLKAQGDPLPPGLLARLQTVGWEEVS
jgi:hypothetical protein